MALLGAHQTRGRVVPRDLVTLLQPVSPLTKSLIRRDVQLGDDRGGSPIHPHPHPRTTTAGVPLTLPPTDLYSIIQIFVQIRQAPFAIRFSCLFMLFGRSWLVGSLNDDLERARSLVRYHLRCQRVVSESIFYCVFISIPALRHACILWQVEGWQPAGEGPEFPCAQSYVFYRRGTCTGTGRRLCLFSFLYSFFGLSKQPVLVKASSRLTIFVEVLPCKAQRPLMTRRRRRQKRKMSLTCLLR